MRHSEQIEPHSAKFAHTLTLNWLREKGAFHIDICSAGSPSVCSKHLYIRHLHNRQRCYQELYHTQGVTISEPSDPERPKIGYFDAPGQRKPSQYHPFQLCNPHFDANPQP